MKKRLLSLLLAFLMLCALVPVSALAVTQSNYPPYAKVEYGYSAGVSVGTIRYISQVSSDSYFYSAYWPGYNFGYYVGPQVECGTASMSMALSYVGEKRYHLPMWLMLPPVKLWFRILTGRSMEEASPLNFIDKLRVPTLLIHGDADTVVPVEFSRELAPKNANITYWECKGAGHVLSLVREPQRYAEAMTELRKEVRL